ncbi:hypothetical protein LCGC14_0325110 [marine sediment metagenome]|uniref:Uncharacterized protein n=1 Tax=marine sediment metagenome TaxID=412755 RepID=A0A0F9U0N9_9ZZZZ
MLLYIEAIKRCYYSCSSDDLHIVRQSKVAAGVDNVIINLALEPLLCYRH